MDFFNKLFGRNRQLNKEVEKVVERWTKRSDVYAASNEVALLQAVKANDINVVKNLIDIGADVNAKDSDGNTALNFASFKGHIEIVKELLAKKVDVNTKNEALYISSSEGHIEIVKELLARGVDVNTKNDALRSASFKGHIDIVKELLAKGADVNEKDNYGNTALICASAKGHIDIVKELLARGADVNAKNNEGYTALGYANAQIAELLKKAGAKE